MIHFVTSFIARRRRSTAAVRAITCV